MKNYPIISFAFGILGCWAAIASPGAWAADEDKFSMAYGFDYSTGIYGAASSTSILSIPVTGMYSSGLWAFKLTVPFVRISGPGGVLPNGIRTKAVSSSKNTTESGLGDVVVAATYSIYSGYDKESWVYLTGKVKFGTADTGIGTGENDYAAQADMYQSFNRFTALGALGYQVLGSPAGVDMNNVVYGILGGYYQVTDQTGGGVEVKVSQKPSAIGAEQQELTAYVSHSIEDGLKIRGYVLKGLADGSPDNGFGLLVSSDL